MSHQRALRTAIALAIFSSLLLGVIAVFDDTSVMGWFYEDDGKATLPLLKKSVDTWNLDISRYKYVGVQSARRGVVIHRWEHLDVQQTDVIDITLVEELACYSKRNNASGQYQHIGCIQYSD